jgi:lipid II:glycine glycyltransferase (peptidoglycan interpeptide bridge formation enzyme)
VFEVCRQNRVVVLYYEPGITNLRSNEFTKLEKDLFEIGFRKTKDSYLPRKTIWIDLGKSEKALLAEMKAKTRYNLGLAKRKDLELKVYSGVDLLRTNLEGVTSMTECYGLLGDNARRLGIFGMPERWLRAQIEAFGNKCFVVAGYLSSSSMRGSKNELLAVNFFLCSKNACFYEHNGSTERGRKLMAPTACVWAGIVEAKRRGLKIFDFDGIDDGSRSLRKWKGFTRFKKGFGGKEIEFNGQYRKFLWPKL